jgi:hypothetical protein
VRRRERGTGRAAREAGEGGMAGGGEEEEEGGATEWQPRPKSSGRETKQEPPAV